MIGTASLNQAVKMEDEQVTVDFSVSEHSCQFFDSRESLAHAVSGFGNPRVADKLGLICHAHSHVRSDPRDELATFLLRASSSPPETMTS